MIQQQIAITTDAAIFYRDERRTKILLIQRKAEPYKGKWALPGGFLEEDEELEDCAKRELQEETGLEVDNLTQLEAFGTLGRDPRGRTITISFYGETAREEKVTGGDDAGTAAWFDIKDLPELAFDHQEIVNLAFSRFSS